MTGGRRSRHADLAGGPVHYVDFGGRGPLVVLIHGLGASHATWLPVGDSLTAYGRVLAVDLAGFGFTPLGHRSAAVRANQRLLDALLQHVDGGPATLVGNSMGGVVSLLQATPPPESVAGVVLVNPGLARPLGTALDRRVETMFGRWLLPGLGERALARRWRRLTPADLVAETLGLCCVDRSRVPAETVDALVQVAMHVREAPNSRRAYLEALRSLLPLLGSPRRFAALCAAVTQPTLLLHGEDDLLVPVASARAVAQARPNWDVEYLTGVGHCPQLEAADRFTQVVGAWLCTALVAGRIADSAG